MSSGPESKAASRKDTVPASGLHDRVHSHTPEELTAAAGDSRLTEEFALALLEHRDLPAGALEALATNVSVMKHRRVIVALVSHPKTPRYVSLPIVRRLYTFELTKLALLPGLAADLKQAAEQAVVARLETVSSGERLTMARQGSTNIAAALLNDPEPRVMRTALENPKLVEANVVRALMRGDTGTELVQAVCSHPRWALRKEVRIALLGNAHTPLARAIEFARSIPTPILQDVLRSSRLSPQIKSYLAQEVERRGR